MKQFFIQCFLTVLLIVLVICLGATSFIDRTVISAYGFIGIMCIWAIPAFIQYVDGTAPKAKPIHIDGWFLPKFFFLLFVAFVVHLVGHGIVFGNFDMYRFNTYNTPSWVAFSFYYAFAITWAVKIANEDWNI